MNQINSHIILSHIDSPSRILLWPAQQVFVFALPFALGMISEHIFVGIFLSFVSAFLFTLFQNKFGKGRFRSMLYWYLPTSSKLIRHGVPPSYIRFWIK